MMIRAPTVSGELDCVVEPMRLSDVPTVLAIERASFSSPWPARAYRYELARNDHSHYFVLRHRQGESLQDDAVRTQTSSSSAQTTQDEAGSPDGPAGKRGSRGLFDRLQRALGHQPQGKIVGYGGFWTSGYQAHISTVAVAPQWRRRRLGLFLMLHMLDCAMALGMRTATLEVRVSNQAAQRLYEKCGFRPSGLLRGYYRDNGEDALLMTTSSLRSRTYQAHLVTLWEQLQECAGHQIEGET